MDNRIIETYRILDFDTDGTKIKTVKRLSDAKEFKIGDPVLHKNNVSIREGVIESFEILPGGSMFVQCSNRGNGYNVPLSYLLHDDRSTLIVDVAKVLDAKLKGIHEEMRVVRNAMRKEYESTTSYQKSINLTRQMEGADKMLAVLEKHIF